MRVWGRRLFLLGLGCLAGCRPSSAAPHGDAEAELPVGRVPTTSASLGIPSGLAGATAVARPGMSWIPPGTLRAGTPPDRVPRVAEEELPGAELTMGGFYIDLLPFPNEPGAIPSSNVTREEAGRLCEVRGKRLCTELEWERACKGPESSTYAYGDAYRNASCGTGVAIEQAAKRPSGERLACKSGFGVMDMHGGVWEWTSSAWGRGGKGGDLAVLKGGNAVAGELVGRCANSIARAPTAKSATLGLRCCAGPHNEAKVELPAKTGIPLERVPRAAMAEITPQLDALAARVWPDWSSDVGGGEPSSWRVWTWRPVANEELVIGGGCNKRRVRSCGVIVGRLTPAGPQLVTQFDGGPEPPDVVLFGEPRRLRAIAVDARGAFTREITYAYGRVDIAQAKH